jgi:hypothetical protein
MSLRLPALALPGLALLPLLASAATLPRPVGDEAVFSIDHEVQVKDPDRFGLNFDPPGMSHWSQEPFHNQWWSGNIINPFITRFRGVATGGSETTLENDASPRLGYFDVFRDGYFEGGEARVYRFADGKMTHVRSGRIARFQASKEGPNVLTFAEPGPAVQAGDDYFIDVLRTDFPPGMVRSLESEPWKIHGSWTLAPNPKALHDAGVRLALSTDAPPDGGGASLALTIPPEQTRPVTVGNWLIDGSNPDWPRFNAGKTYTVRLSLKQTGMPSGEVLVNVASMHTERIRATDTWRDHSFDFVASPPKSRAAERFEIGSAEPGTLLIDNVTIVERDGPPPFGFYPHVVDTLRRFRPSTIRLWNLQENKGSANTLDGALFAGPSAPAVFNERNGTRTSVPVSLHDSLVLCAEVGTDPWIITSVLFSLEEQAGLMEYLAGPADTPYGRKRAERGQVKPWTEVFQRIKIETGNETWNGMFGPQAFGGRAAQYGAWSELIFQAMKSSPHFRAEKFQFVVNGWAANTTENGYGGRALQSSPSAQAVGIAYYTGGWDAVGLLKSESPEESWMNILTYSRRMLSPRALQAKATSAAIAERRGRPGSIDTLVYEAGPGYTLPGPGKFNMAEQEEGKSLAQAINSLDIFMTNLAAGYGDQSFFTFRNGHYWASHNRAWGEHIAWKALGLRNSLLHGDLITSRATRMVTLDLPESRADTISQSNSANRRVRTFPPVPGMPLIDCYAFRDGSRYGFMLISRRLDGPTRVTLELPYEPQSAYTLHELTGESPALHNIQEEVVRVRTHEREGMSRRHTLMVPAHSVLVLVNQSR